jgi:hypothetical protein
VFDHTLIEIQVIANDLGFVTQSRFTVNNVKRVEDVQKFIDKCNSMLGVEVVRDHQL